MEVRAAAAPLPSICRLKAAHVERSPQRCFCHDGACLYGKEPLFIHAGRSAALQPPKENLSETICQTNPCGLHASSFPTKRLRQKAVSPPALILLTRISRASMKTRRSPLFVFLRRRRGSARRPQTLRPARL